MRSHGFRCPRISSAQDPARAVLVAAAMVLAAVAAVARTHGLGPAASATAGPFLTLAAIITLGVLADRVGVFRWLARILVPKDSSAVVAYAALLILTALLSGLINLDVAVVVAMPVGLDVASRVQSGAAGSAWRSPRRRTRLPSCFPRPT
jgi:Na+/H+ antiporter NhaD/arsenite permease-like protein